MPQAFTSATGKHVALLGDGYWPFWPTKANAGGAGRSVAQVNADAIAHWKAGGLPYIQSSFPSPERRRYVWHLRSGAGYYARLRAIHQAAPVL